MPAIASKQARVLAATARSVRAFSVGGSFGVTPNQIAGLVVGIDVLGGIWQDAGITLAGVNDPVGQWDDYLSGNNRHATQSTAANKPTLRADGIEFDGTDDVLDLPTAGYPLSAHTIAVAIKKDWTADRAGGDTGRIYSTTSATNPARTFVTPGLQFQHIGASTTGVVTAVFNGVGTYDNEYVLLFMDVTNLGANAGIEAGIEALGLSISTDVTRATASSGTGDIATPTGFGLMQYLPITASSMGKLLGVWVYDSVLSVGDRESLRGYAVSLL